MRESKSKNGKTHDNSDENNSASIIMELELAAVKAKNSELIKAHTKVVWENSEMKNQINTLQAELFDIQAKYNNLEAVLRNLEQNMKKCTPHLIDILNLFLHFSESSRNSFNMVHLTTSDTGFTPKSKAITHTVKPHTVNGTVLNLVPTISLTRLNTTSTSQRLNDISSIGSHVDYSNPLPSTSTCRNNDENENENFSPNLDVSDVENQSFVSRRRNTNSTPDVRGPLNLAETEEQSSDESEQEEEQSGGERIQNLSTIQEESMCSSGRKRTSLGEVRIYLSRLSAEDLAARRSRNDSFSSTQGNANDTCLNIETTVIENEETRVSKRLRADIMVFSPHTNSTRMENANSMFDSLSPRDDRRKISGSAVSAIQSAEVTPSTSIQNGNEEVPASDRLAWLPTPSLSALGDIDVSNTQLEILQASTNKIEISKISPVSPSASPLRNTRSANRIQNKSNAAVGDESPRSSVENQNGRRTIRSFVKRRRGDSGDRLLTPTIFLDRIENTLSDNEVTALNIQIVAPPDEPKENKNPPIKRETRSKKGKAKSRDKSLENTVKRKRFENTDREVTALNIQFLAQPDEPKNNKNSPKERETRAKEGKSKYSKESIKRKLKDEEQEAGTLKEKIREIQIRLSNYIPEGPESSQNGNRVDTTEVSLRPTRAARPTSLKDASLKGKLRRLI